LSLASEHAAPPRSDVVPLQKTCAVPPTTLPTLQPRPLPPRVHFQAAPTAARISTSRLFNSVPYCLGPIYHLTASPVKMLRSARLYCHASSAGSVDTFVQAPQQTSNLKEALPKAPAATRGCI